MAFFSWRSFAKADSTASGIKSLRRRKNTDLAFPEPPTFRSEAEHYGPAARHPRPNPWWTELVPPYAIGTVAMSWVIQRIGEF